MPNRIPPFRTLVAITRSDGSPTPEFTRWVETLMDAADLAGDNATAAQSTADAAQSTADAAQGSSVFYNFTANTSVAADTWTTVDWSTPTSTLFSRLADGASYLSSGRVLAANNEVFSMRVDITFSADDATASYLRFGLTDDAGGFGTFLKPLHPVLLGASVEDEATFSFTTYTDTTINASGWLPQVLSDGPVTITKTQVFFTRQQE